MKLTSARMPNVSLQPNGSFDQETMSPVSYTHLDVYKRQVVDAWVDTMFDGEKSREASDALVAALEGYAGTDAEAKNIVSYVLENKDQLVKKSQWIFGGDGWAYDIGYGGLDHVLASGCLLYTSTSWMMTIMNLMTETCRWSAREAARFIALEMPCR